MIFTTGDSHSRWTFHNIREIDVDKTPSLSITMWRIGHTLDGLVPGIVSVLQLTPDDTLILSAGEIDCRYHIHGQVASGKNLDEMLQEMIGAYLDVAQALPLNGAKLAILGVVPPVPMGKIYYGGEILPVEGSNADRLRYTLGMNQMLENECERRGLPFIDVYWDHADDSGLLDPQYSDGNVHVKGGKFVREELKRRGIIP